MKNKMGTIVLDLDGTLCKQCDSKTYHTAEPFKGTIKKVNELFTEGWEIIIFTARGMNTCNGDVNLVEQLYRDMTEKWLKDNRVFYDKLMFGKPAADYYIDDKNLSIDEFNMCGITAREIKYV